MSLCGFLRRHWPVAAVAAVYLVCLAILPLDGIWINDVGSRVIQARSIGAAGFSDFSIRWPGAAVDPSFDWAPIAYPFAVVRDGRLFSVYSPVLATLAAPLNKVFGYPGLYLLPLAGSIAMLAGVGKLAGEVTGNGPARALAILMTGLCTPVWFYSLTFWEHTIAACFCVWSLLYLMRFLKTGSPGPVAGSMRNVAAAAVFSSAATYFRPEIYTFALVLVGFVVWRAPSARLKCAAVFAAAAIAALVPLWLFHWAAVGSALGLHLGTLVSSTSGLIEHIQSRPLMFFYQFLLSSPGYAWSLVLTIPFVALLAARPRLSEKAFSAAVPLLGLAGLAILILIYASFRAASRGAGPIGFVGCTNSVFATVPFVILGLVRLRDEELARAPFPPSADTLWLVAVMYGLVYWLAAPEITKWGIHWGNRYLLVLYPLLAVLAAGNVAGWLARASGGGRLRVAGRMAVVAVVLASFAAQAWSVTILRRKMDYSARLNHEVAARPEKVVVTSLWWVGQELYDQFDKKMIFLVTSREHYGDLMRRLAARGYSRYLAVLPAGEPAPSDWGRRSEAVRISDNGLGNWEVNLVGLDVRPGQPFGVD